MNPLWMLGWFALCGVAFMLRGKMVGWRKPKWYEITILFVVAFVGGLLIALN